MPQKKKRFPVIPVLLALFTLFTLAEIWLIFQMAKLISWPLTILIAIGTGLIGSVMIKRQGISVMHQGITQARGGTFPGQPIAEGLIIIVGGAFLMTPGLITDLIGLSTLVPPIRLVYARLLIGFVMRNFQIKVAGQSSAGNQQGFFYSGGQSTAGPRSPFEAKDEGTTQSQQNPFNTQQPGAGKRSFSEEDVIDVEFTRRD